MNNFTYKISRCFLDKCVALLPKRVAGMLEWRIQKTLGKGIGFGSVFHEVRTIKMLLSEISLDSPSLMDVGANTGQYALEFMKEIPNSRVYSFEPGREAFLLLSQRSQGILSWKSYNFGFGSEPTTMILHSDIPGSAGASLYWNHDSMASCTYQRQAVDIRCIDDFIEDELNFVPDIVKLDVEGFEMSCIEGMKQHLKSVKLVQFEFGPSHINARNFFYDFWSLFQEHNFQVVRVTDKQPIVIRRYATDLETFAVTNYIALNNRYFSRL